MDVFCKLVFILDSRFISSVPRAKVVKGEGFPPQAYWQWEGIGCCVPSRRPLLLSCRCRPASHLDFGTRWANSLVKYEGIGSLDPLLRYRLVE